MFLINGKKRSSTIAYEKFPPQKQEGQMKYNIKAHHIVDIKEGSVVNGGEPKPHHTGQHVVPP
jgi:hypothetical protein